jgi:sulfite reductase alpha subunit-like flavoprotein
VHTAFSRFEGEKTYVQHRIVEDATAKALATLLCNGAIIFVSGNAKQMPRDVERALTSVVQHFVFNGVESDAVQFIKMCKTDGRYITDTWS